MYFSNKSCYFIEKENTKRYKKINLSVSEQAVCNTSEEAQLVNWRESFRCLSQLLWRYPSKRILNKLHHYFVRYRKKPFISGFHTVPRITSSEYFAWWIPLGLGIQNTSSRRSRSHACVFFSFGAERTTNPSLRFACSRQCDRTVCDWERGGGTKWRILHPLLHVLS